MPPPPPPPQPRVRSPRAPNARTQKHLPAENGCRLPQTVAKAALPAESHGLPRGGADHAAAGVKGAAADDGRSDGDVIEEHVRSLGIRDARSASDPACGVNFSVDSGIPWSHCQRRPYRPQETQALADAAQKFTRESRQQPHHNLRPARPQHAAEERQAENCRQSPEQPLQQTDGKSQTSHSAAHASLSVAGATSFSAPASSVSTTQNSPDSRPRSKTVHVVNRRAVAFSPPPEEAELPASPPLHFQQAQENRPAFGATAASPDQTNGTNFCSKSLPVSRRNSGDLSGIWKELEGLGLDDDIEPAGISGGQHHSSKKYRSLTDAEGGFFSTGIYADTISTSARMSRNFTFDGSISTYPDDSYGQFRHLNASEAHAREEPGHTGSPTFVSKDDAVQDYLQLSDSSDQFPILVRHNSHPGMVSTFAATGDPSSPSRVSIGRSVERPMQDWSPEHVSAEEVPPATSGEDTRARHSGSRRRPLYFGPRSLGAGIQTRHYALGGRPPSIAAESYGPASRQHHGGRAHHPGHGVFDTSGGTFYEENAILVSGQSKHGAGVCKYFQQGSCSKGSRCSFSHVFQGPQAQLHLRAKDPNYHQYYQFHQSQNALFYHQPHHQHHPHHHQNQHHHHRLQRHQHSGIGAAGDTGVSAYLGGGPHGPALYMGGAASANPYLGTVRPPPGLAAPDYYHVETFPTVGTSGGARYAHLGHHHRLPLAYAGAQSAYSNDATGGEPRSPAVPVKTGSRRSLEMDDKAADRFAGVRPENIVGEIYNLSKDQNGCRHLQKMLEEQNEQCLDMIFNEVIVHFPELMTDPFGNYLCQKLLEHCTDEQRTMISEAVAPDLMRISLNMHGTRAVQKMIDYISNPIQIRSLTVAFASNVVILIKDLNGNHVIQKCLYKLSSENNQFIYDAVSQHCIEVATHRHGCCVLQRCIDHASDAQKIQLVTEITCNALTLVQDPFGNYVVQYVLDLGDARFSETIVRRFIGNVSLLSVQKFSSNVMEKCIRVTDNETRWRLIDEMLNQERLDKLLRDSYGNYVVQTALDYADPLQRAKLVESILPLLPAIRSTPYGKRIQCKLQCEIHVPPLTGPGVAEGAAAGGSGVGGAGIGIKGCVHELNAAAAAAAAGFTHFAQGSNSGGFGHRDFKVYPYM